MEFATYDPIGHYRLIADLWARALGDIYPITERVLLPRIVARNTLELGDGIVVYDGDRLIAFGLLEIDRCALTPSIAPTVQIVLVDPLYQRQGLGSEILERLEARLRLLGCTGVGVAGGPLRFWTGIPDNLPAARAFFEKHGYTRHYVAVDMCGAIKHTEVCGAMRKLVDEDISIQCCSHEDVGRAYEFLTRENPDWRGSFLSQVIVGDATNMLLLTRGVEIIGCVQTYPPRSRYRSANLVWERLYSGETMGGVGSVLIASAWRGQGLGTALIQAAAQYLQSAGATICYIDWTSHNLAHFYRWVGVDICMEFGMYGKSPL